MEAAQRARALGIPVFTIALGTPDGVVEIPDDFGQRRLVRVPPDYDTLRSIAQVTHAEYFYAPTESELRRIYDEIGSRIGFEREEQELTYAFAGAALVLAAAAGVAAFAWGNRFP
jgi:Ca-activated chloride channel homolog